MKINLYFTNIFVKNGCKNFLYKLKKTIKLYQLKFAIS